VRSPTVGQHVVEHGDDEHERGAVGHGVVQQLQRLPPQALLKVRVKNSLESSTPIACWSNDTDRIAHMRIRGESSAVHEDHRPTPRMPRSRFVTAAFASTFRRFQRVRLTSKMSSDSR